MGLLDLLKDPNAYRPGGGSKELKYKNPPLLGSRVTFPITDPDANPEFLYGLDHSKNNSEDVMVRGGLMSSLDRRRTDRDRISNFLFKTPIGKQFIAKQVATQALNKYYPQTYNLGINTLQSVQLAGLSNIERGGLLSIGGINVESPFKRWPYDDENPDLGTKYENKIYPYGEGTNDMGTIINAGQNPEGEVSFAEADYYKRRELHYNLGDPGKKDSIDNIQELINSVNPFSKGYSYSAKIPAKIDKVNALPILVDTDVSPKLNSDLENASKDLVKFRFEIHRYDDTALLDATTPFNKNIHTGNHLIVFRAFLDKIGDDYKAGHNKHKYNGRAENFYTYASFDRKISLGFKIAAQSRWEMKPLYQKLNYLAAQTAPNYSSKSGRMRTPFMYLTVGDWFNRLPGVLSSVNLSWQKNYPWEIAIDKMYDPLQGNFVGKDKNMLVLPHVLDVSINFMPIHSFAPNNSPQAPFIGIDGGALQNINHDPGFADTDENSLDLDWRNNIITNTVPNYTDYADYTNYLGNAVGGATTYAKDGLSDVDIEGFPNNIQSKINKIISSE
jgi:hypothetical protein